MADFARALPPELEGKKVAILGVAREGIATAKWLAGRGLVPTICDRLPREDLGKAYDELSGIGVSDWRLGEDYLDSLTDFDVVFRTPLLPANDDNLEKAREAGVIVSSQTKLFFELCPAPIVGVTGTKGKGTTAGLLHAMLKAGGKDSYLGGNIGTPPLEFLDQLTKDSIVVLELSSFQLEDLERSPQVAIVTNVTADHLDRHESIEEYRAAKRPILAYQDADGLAILNQDDQGAKDMAEFAGGQVAWFSVHRPVSDGAFAEGGKLQLAYGDDPGDICDANQLLVPGPHNRANVLAAAVAAARLGVDRESMRAAAIEYRGLPYHLEFVGEHDDVKFFNDSYATNQTATIPAIESFDAPLVVIVGGQGKGLEYDELAKAILEREIRAVITMPPEGERIEAALIDAATEAGKTVPDIQPVKNKDEIVPLAVKLAKPGDVVLFSPAATSFNWFESYVKRGEFFTQAVKAL
jgi:UDP-N-acetylmuramoylalanine--D-glutamate ligase